ncbi:hypothetical protein AXX04_13665 [Pseudomonas aeruginosa]|nr:hypothetical protein AXX04_13665 [Pseudomonas aeruginosa]
MREAALCGTMAGLAFGVSCLVSMAAPVLVEALVAADFLCQFVLPLALGLVFLGAVDPVAAEFEKLVVA